MKDTVIERRPTGAHVVCKECGTTIVSFTFKMSLPLIQKFAEIHYKQARHDVTL